MITCDGVTVACRPSVARFDNYIMVSVEALHSDDALMMSWIGESLDFYC